MAQKEMDGQKDDGKQRGARLRLSPETESKLRLMLTEAGRTDEVSKFVEEICRFYTSGELVRIRPDMIQRLLSKRTELKRREDLGPFIEWICQLFLDPEERPQSTGKLIVGAKFGDKVKTFEPQRKAS